MVVLLLLTLLTRLAVLIGNHPFPPLQKDDSVYDALATNLMAGHGFSSSPAPPYEPMALRPPAYPGFLAGVYLVAGHSTDAVRIAQIAISVATCYVLMLIAGRLFGSWTARLAGLAFALLPAAATAPSLLLTETNQSLLLAIAVLSLILGIERSSGKWFALTGVSLAVATLTKPDVQLLAVPLFVAAAVLYPGERRRIAAGAVLFLVLLTPWVLRNRVVFGRFIGVSTGAGYAGIVSELELTGHTGDQLHAALAARYGEDFSRRHGRPMTFLDGGQPEEDALRRAELVQFVQTHPATYAEHSVKRALILWQPRSWSDAFGLPNDFGEYFRARQYGALGAKLALLAIDAAIIGLGWLGVVFSLFAWRRSWPLLVCVLYLTTMIGLVHAVERYRLPVMPVMVILAGNAVVRLGRLSRAGGSGSDAADSVGVRTEV
jgi:4-amino-4-deoxy-L-arabinose transferase-like glycosyltransferase